MQSQELLTTLAGPDATFREHQPILIAGFLLGLGLDAICQTAPGHDGRDSGVLCLWLHTTLLKATGEQCLRDEDPVFQSESSLKL